MYSTVKEMGAGTLLAHGAGGGLYVLKPMSAEDAEVAGRLRQISSPNVARVFSPVEMNGRLYFVREYIEGITLEEHINAFGPMNDESARRIICDICRGLTAIHAQGIVHRDITPANIIVNKHGGAVIIDFDISRISKPGKAADTQILGTHGYAAPEQFGFSQTGPRADIYALGVLTNFIKTGTLPDVVQANGVFRKIVEKCTRMDENYRFQSAEEIEAMLEGRARPANILHRLPGFRSHRMWREVTACVYLTLYIGVTVVGFCAMGPTIFEKFVFLGMMFFIFLVPVPLICDLGRWSRKLPLVKSFTNGGRLFVRLCAAALSVLGGIMLILLVPKR